MMTSKYIKIFFILALTIVQSTSSFSQSNGDEYFEIYDNTYTVMPYYTLSKLKLNLSGKYDISYRPDKSSDIGLYGAYKKFGFGIGIGVLDGITGEETDKVRFYDFRLNYYGRRIGVDGHFQFYRSFNVEGSSEELPDSAITTDRANQKLNNIGINIYYNFNEKHSFKAVYSHTERQLKSNGAFLLGLSHVYTYLQADGTYFADDIKSQYDVNDYTRQTKLFSVIPIVGYQYTVVYKRFYFSPLLLVGAGAQFQKYPNAADDIEFDIKLVKKIVANIPIGYNGDKFFYGFIFKSDFLKSNIKTLNLNFTLLSYNLFVGYRF